MKAKQLCMVLSGLDDMEVVVALSRNADGSLCYMPIKAVNFGFNWEEGKVVLIPKDSIDNQPET